MKRKLMLASLTTDRRGATAVEFALVGSMFIVMLMSIFDLVLLYLVNSGLIFALEETARQSMVGNSLLRSSREAFVEALCSQTLLVPSCATRLAVDLRAIDPLALPDLTMPLDVQGGIEMAALQFEPGGGDAYILARAAVTYQFITPFLGELLDNTGQGRTILMATTAFRNEPFQ